MTDEHFRQLVRDMRAEQAEYFKFRKRSVLDRCRELEKAVDNELAGIKTAPPAPTHPELF